MEKDLLDQGNEPEEGSVCPACAAFVGINEVFCPACRAPISLLANTDPLQRVYTEAFIYRKAVESKPKLIVVVGIWILFFPLAALAISVVAMALSVGSGSGVAGFIILWLAVLGGAFCVVVLYRVTKNYFKYEPHKFDELD